MGIFDKSLKSLEPTNLNKLLNNTIVDNKYNLSGTKSLVKMFQDHMFSLHSFSFCAPSDVVVPPDPHEMHCWFASSGWYHPMGQISQGELVELLPKPGIQTEKIM